PWPKSVGIETDLVFEAQPHRQRTVIKEQIVAKCRVLTCLPTEIDDLSCPIVLDHVVASRTENQKALPVRNVREVVLLIIDADHGIVRFPIGEIRLDASVLEKFREGVCVDALPHAGARCYSDELCSMNSVGEIEP